MPLASTTSPPRKSRSSVVTTPGTRRKDDYSVVPVVEACSEACHLGEQCVCTLCKYCLNCSNKCSCKFANTGADESLAKHLLPRISPEYL